MLARKREIISWNQQFAGKILGAKDLASLLLGSPYCLCDLSSAVGAVEGKVRCHRGVRNRTFGPSHRFDLVSVIAEIAKKLPTSGKELRRKQKQFFDNLPK
jgi:hypothetical protein